MMISVSVRKVSAVCLKLSVHSLDSVALRTDWGESVELPDSSSSTSINPFKHTGGADQ